MRNNLNKNRGALLLELLIVISLLAIILSIGSQAVFVSMQSGKISSESDVAMGLASETLEAVRAVADEKWQNIYDLAGKGSTHYKTVQSGVKWTLVSGDETIALNTASYTRYVLIQNVCRNTTPTSRDVTGITDTNGSLTTCATSTGIFDPSTQKVSVTVSWSGSGSPVTVSDYFIRWKNKVCPQTSWAGGASTGVKSCPGAGDTTYETSTNLGTPGATLQVY